MKIQGGINPLKNIQPEQKTGKTEKSQSSKFDNVLQNFVDKVDESSKTSKQLTQDFIMGGDVEIHEVMIAAEKAKTDLMLLTEIRNKALETYKELSRM